MTNKASGVLKRGLLETPPLMIFPANETFIVGFHIFLLHKFQVEKHGISSYVTNQELGCPKCVGHQCGSQRLTLDTIKRLVFREQLQQTPASNGKNHGFQIFL